MIERTWQFSSENQKRYSNSFSSRIIGKKIYVLKPYKFNFRSRRSHRKWRQKFPCRWKKKTILKLWSLVAKILKSKFSSAFIRGRFTRRDCELFGDAQGHQSSSTGRVSWLWDWTNEKNLKITLQWNRSKWIRCWRGTAQISITHSNTGLLF